MGNSKKKTPGVPDETYLSLPSHPQSVDYTIPIMDTHTHLLSTYQRYKSLYPNPRYDNVFSFVREFYGISKEVGISRHRTEAIVDVWCEAPVTPTWKEIADSCLSDTERKEKWGGVEYWFVMGKRLIIRSRAKLMSIKVFIRKHFLCDEVFTFLFNTRHEVEHYSDSVENEM